MSWKNGNIIEMVLKINQVLNTQFTKTDYEFYIEAKVLKSLKLENEYPDTASKGSITMMVVRMKSKNCWICMGTFLSNLCKPYFLVVGLLKNKQHHKI